MGVHQGHSNSPRKEPRLDEVGRSSRGCFQVPQVGGCGSNVGPKKEEQQHDV